MCFLLVTPGLKYRKQGIFSLNYEVKIRIILFNAIMDGNRSSERSEMLPIFLTFSSLRPPFISLSSLSARIRHLRSYLSWACSCSIFINRLIVSVRMPGLSTSSIPSNSCCRMRGNQAHSGRKVHTTCVCGVQEKRILPRC